MYPGTFPVGHGFPEETLKHPGTPVLTWYPYTHHLVVEVLGPQGTSNVLVHFNASTIPV